MSSTIIAARLLAYVCHIIRFKPGKTAWLFCARGHGDR